MDVFCDEAWLPSPHHHSWNHLEDVILAVLDGGFTRTVWRDQTGRITHFAMNLEGTFGHESGGTVDLPDEGETGHASSYPAWPPRPV